MSLNALLDRSSVRGLAGEASFWRGVGYLEEGRVGRIRTSATAVTATVHGTDDYTVRLKAKDGALEWACTCPMGEDGHFCKHCVAVALTVSGEPYPDAGPGADEIRDHLASRSHEELVELVWEHACSDERLWGRLVLDVARSRIDADDLGTFRAAVDEALTVDGFVPYRHAYAFARGAHEVVDAIEELLGDRPVAVIELAEHALKLAEGALGRVDDSDGELGGVLTRLQDVHHEACRRARPDPVELARRLFAWELRTDWDTFFDAADTYADVLGRKGLAEYRRLAEERWAEVPALGPGEDDGERFGRRFRITKIMQALARRTGDLEALVGVHARDLSSPYCFLEIATICRDGGRDELALEWAERGLEAFGPQTDPRLREFLADEYGRRDRHDDALRVAWELFTDRPGLETYRTLAGHAERAGAWTQWRERALKHLRKQIATEKREAKTSPVPRPRGAAPADHSTLVRIFLWEGDAEAAWQEAQKGGCSDGLWYELAEARADEHPEDAVDVYKRLVAGTLTHAHRRNYEEAVGLMAKIEKLLIRLGRPDEFTVYVQTVREAHKRKKNLLKLLDRKQWR